MSNICSSIRIYKVSTRVPKGPPSLVTWNKVLETQPCELLDLGLLREVKVYGDIVTILFARFPDMGMGGGETRILCFNTSTRIRVVITGLNLVCLFKSTYFLGQSLTQPSVPLHFVVFALTPAFCVCRTRSVSRTNVVRSPQISPRIIRPRCQRHSLQNRGTEVNIPYD